MKSPVISVEVRWKLADEADWQVRSFLPGAKIALRDLTRGDDYDIETRNVGVNGLASAWVAVAVTVPDTNRRGPAALPVSVVANQGSMWDVDTEVTYAATSDMAGVAEATISVTAGTLVIGSRTIAYAASSATVEGTADEVRTVYLYYDDPRLQGGSRTLGVTTNVVQAANANGRVAITSMQLTFPEPGGSGGGGGGIGGGGGGGGPRPPYNQLPV